MRNKMIVLCTVTAGGKRREVRYFQSRVDFTTVTLMASRISNLGMAYLDRTHISRQKLDHSCDNKERSLLEAWKFDSPIPFVQMYFPMENIIGMELWAKSYIAPVESLEKGLLIRE